MQCKSVANVYQMSLCNKFEGIFFLIYMIKLCKSRNNSELFQLLEQKSQVMGIKQFQSYFYR